MKLIRTSLALLVAGALVISLIACCGISAAEAQPPEWEEGDAWAAGFEVDLGGEYGEQISQIEELLNEMDVELNNFDVDGTASFWILFEVTDVTSEQYVLSGVLAQKLVFSANIEVTGELPAEGSYTGAQEIPTEQKTVSFDGSIDYALVIRGDITMEKETLAIKNVDLDVKCSAIVDLEINNLPEFNNDFEQTTISYQDADTEITFDLDLAINVVFDPALDIFQFPFDTGDTWTAESNATISGTVEGIFDASGLPPEVMEDIFETDFLIENGVTDFPIIFDELVIQAEDGPQINNGIIEEFSGPVVIDMACNGKKLTTIPNYGTVTVYELEVNEEWCFLYSSDIEFLTSIDINIDDIMEEMDLEMPVGVPEELMTPLEENSLEMGSSDPGTAKSQISTIEEFQGSISEEAESGTSESGDAMNDFFFKAPYFGFILVALVIVIVVSALYAGIRRK